MTGCDEELVGGEVCGDSRVPWGQGTAALGWAPLRQERP